MEKATFAGGCFWCLEHDLRSVKGVASVTSGYTGGWVQYPTYEEVCRGSTGHLESVEVVFDPASVTYEELLNLYWRSIDPTRSDGQFCDVGPQYRPAIFYHNEEQRRQAEASKAKVAKSMQPVKVDILPAETFYPAEEYHQDFSEKDPLRYHSYRQGSGRDRRLKELWG